MKKYDNEVYENIPNVTSCEDQTENIEVEKLGEIVNVKRRMGKKILIGTVFFIIVSFVGFAIGRPFYNNGEVTNRTITLNIDLRDIKGKYTGTIKDGLPDGNGRFTYTVGKKDIRYTGTFSKGKFINGMGYMVDNQGNVAYHGEFKNGLPDEKIFKEIRQSVTGYSLREWALDENLFKCYQQIGTITQVNQWGGTENVLCSGPSDAAQRNVYVRWRSADGSEQSL